MTVTAEVPEISTGDLLESRRWLRRRKGFAWSLVAPCVLFLLLVGLYPTIYVFALSFSEFQPGSTLQWVGLNNFITRCVREWIGPL